MLAQIIIINNQVNCFQMWLLVVNKLDMARNRQTHKTEIHRSRNPVSFRSMIA